MYSSADIKILLGKRIKELRKQKNLTQEELAERMNIDQRNLSKIECGNNFITAETLSKLLYALNIEACELFSFNHQEKDDILKEKLVRALKEDNSNIKLLYQFYQIIRKN